MQRAILIVGPTGSGKTPLGEYIASRGLAGRRAAHFDFGENLRLIDQGQGVRLSADDVAVVRDSLRTGALLENERFYIAGHVLAAFVAAHGLAADDYVILNGMPRHVGQAADVDAIADVQRVIYLDCSPEVVHARISCNSGGDREGRVDDAQAAVEAKLKIFKERTMPLLDYYRSRGVKIVDYIVGLESDPVRIYEELGLQD